ncbi:MAG: hypothetical protein SFU56_03400 [Capsulimonadales bacterium]|nr:hypothetical protein [Capsulimonadales bacterium]
MSKGVIWALYFVIGFALQWAALQWRRRSLQGGEPPMDFVISFGIFAAITTIFAGIALGVLFVVARRASDIPIPNPHPGNALILWAVLILLALDSNRYGIGNRAFRWDELLLNLDALLAAVCLTGVAMALRIESVRKAVVENRDAA